MATIRNLLIDQGTDFTITVDATDGNGSPLPDLETYTLVGHIKKSYYTSSYVEFSLSVGVDEGSIVASLPASVNSTMKPGRYVYDIFIISSGNVSTRLLEGILTITPRVARPTTTTTTTAAPTTTSTTVVPTTTSTTVVPTTTTTTTAAPNALPNISNITAWWDSTEGLTPYTWIDRTNNGNDLPATGTVSILGNIINGQPVFRSLRTSPNSAFSGPLELPVVGPPLSMWTLLNIRSLPGGSFYPFGIIKDVNQISADGYIELYGDNSSFGLDISTGNIGYEAVDGITPVPVGDWLFIEITSTSLSDTTQFRINGILLESNNEFLPHIEVSFGYVNIGRYSIYYPADPVDFAMFGLSNTPLTHLDRIALYTWVNQVYGLNIPMPTTTTTTTIAPTTTTTTP